MEQLKWTEIRRRVLTKELSKRTACRLYGVHWQTLAKMLAHEEPSGYQRNQPRAAAEDRALCADRRKVSCLID